MSSVSLRTSSGNSESRIVVCYKRERNKVLWKFRQDKFYLKDQDVFMSFEGEVSEVLASGGKFNEASKNSVIKTNSNLMQYFSKNPYKNPKT